MSFEFSFGLGFASVLGKGDSKHSRGPTYRFRLGAGSFNVGEDESSALHRALWPLNRLPDMI